MRRILRRIPRLVGLVIAAVVVLGVLALVILTALGAFAGARKGPFEAPHPAGSAGRPSVGAPAPRQHQPVTAAELS